MKDDRITTFTLAEVEGILEDIKNYVKNDKFEVPTNRKRQGNKEFIETYNLSNEKIKNILLKITALDFCHGVPDRRAKGNILYVFCPLVALVSPTHDSISIELAVYTKISIVIGKQVVVVSFHPRKGPIDYLFL
ncbi:MAG: hypothetical protein LBI54_00490 [Lachnospiraceae bacterium]|jgi:hypothetical protein|nr:hypothetical protein [Lachnospiraceae bacterium]